MDQAHHVQVRLGHFWSFLKLFIITARHQATLVICPLYHKQSCLTSFGGEKQLVA